MEFKVISTVEIETESETALKTLIETINTFVNSQNGKAKHLIRTIEEQTE